MFVHPMLYLWLPTTTMNQIIHFVYEYEYLSTVTDGLSFLGRKSTWLL